MKVLAISSSPRRDGNTSILTSAVVEGVMETGHSVDLIHLSDVVTTLLRDCRKCRAADGQCTIADGFERLFLLSVLQADALVFGTPLYWYGMSGALKTFLDRFFCFIAGSYPDAERVREALAGKRLAVVIASEESYWGSSAGVMTSLQEFARYLSWDLVGVVQGIGNSRGDVLEDPALPLARAKELGARLFDARVTDYRLETPRNAKTWAS